MRETGNNLVVGKVLTEADFNFQMTSWDTNCDMMALLEGKTGDIAASHGPAHSDAAKTRYRWENASYVNIASPWKVNTGTQGGNIGSGVLIPSYFPSALNYKFGVKSMAEQVVTLRGGAYFMNYGGYPIEEIAKGTGEAVSFETKETAAVLRVGGHGSTEYQHIFGVLVNGEIQLNNVDYVEEGGAKPGEAATKVKIKFAKAPPAEAVVRFMYFSTEAHALNQTVHESTITSPAAVRGRDIEIFVGKIGEGAVKIHGIQDISLEATCTGEILREMGTYDPIGYAVTGTDTNGQISMQPQNQEAFYKAISEMTGLELTDVIGYINQYPIPLTMVINNPSSRGSVLKSIYVEDAIFQPPGSTVKVNTVSTFPIRWESLEGTFSEFKESLPA